MKPKARCLVSLLLISMAASCVRAQSTEVEARNTLRRAIAFFRTQVAVEGGYVWRYSADLQKREGEGKLDHRTAWVEPPGTPFVGSAYLKVFDLCGETSALEAARETSQALLRGQLHSGGWCARIDFDEDARRKRAYFVDGKARRKARNVSILDDDRTQSAIRFLAEYDRITQFKDAGIGTAVRRALDSLLAAQHRNGAWAQVYRGPATDSGRNPKLRASLRKAEYPRVKEYWDFYTINDDVMSDCIQTLLLVANIYDDDRYRTAALRGGDFLLSAQLPEPQPGWAQQYDMDMHPAWARKFEPPAVSGSEGPKVLKTLMDIYASTGQRKYLAPIPRALEYYEKSKLKDGRLARFYELSTNRPLYFNRQYELTYSDADLPTHYSFQVSVDLNAIRRRYEQLSKAKKPETKKPETKTARPSRRSRSGRPDAERIRQIISSIDDRGAWVESGKLRFWGKADSTQRVILPETFATNVQLLARFLSR